MDMTAIIIFSVMTILFIITDIHTTKKEVIEELPFAFMLKYIIVLFLFFIAIIAVKENIQFRHNYKCPQYEKIEDAYRLKP